MRIAHYYANGLPECGIADERGRIRSPAACAELKNLAPHERFLALLTMDPEARERVNEAVLADGPVVLETPARLAPAAPNPPLYIYGHGNAATIWKRQSDKARQWEMPRVPHVRVRPWQSLSGHGDTVHLPAGAKFSGGTELGVVIGKAARNVRREEAAGHIVGVVALNDGYLSGAHEAFNANRPGRSSTIHNQALDTVYKSSDGVGGLGPWIITVEELQRDFIARAGTDRLEAMAAATRKSAFLYDLILRNYRNARCVDRSHSGAYLLDAEHLVAYYSRFMTLAPGTIIGLGACGWDGQSFVPGPQPGDRCEIDVEVEEYGRCRMTLVRGGAQEAQRESPLLARRIALGLPPVPDSAERSTRALWIARGNYRESPAREGIPEWMGLSPFCYPWSVMGDASAPLTLPAHATTIRCAAELAVVVGEPIYNLSGPEALRRCAGVAVMLQVMDTSLGDHLTQPTDYESRSAWKLGGFGDGFCRLGPVVPLAQAGDLRRTALRVFASDGRCAESRTADYRFALEDMLAMASRTSTLLPGDVLSLGWAGETLDLPAQPSLPIGARLGASAEGLGEIAVEVADHRSREAQEDNREYWWPEAAR